MTGLVKQSLEKEATTSEDAPEAAAAAPAKGVSPFAVKESQVAAAEGGAIGQQPQCQQGGGGCDQLEVQGEEEGEEEEEEEEEEVLSYAQETSATVARIWPVLLAFLMSVTVLYTVRNMCA